MSSNEFIELIILAFRKEVIKKLVFSRPLKGEINKVSGRVCKAKSGKVLSLEYSLPGNTVTHKNLSDPSLPDELCTLISDYNQVNLMTTLGDAEFKRSKSDKTVALGADALKRKLSVQNKSFESAIEELDRRKSYILDGTEPFLVALGISDKGGRVHDKKQAKFRQINRFLEHISDIYSKLPSEGTLRIYDLCCGKSYLSFAVYHYMTVIKQREVYMYAADLKRDVILWCESLSKELGYTGMHFEVGDIRELTYGKEADLVTSLHACDIATDIVLSTAVRLSAKVILSTPCCHKNMRDNISAQRLSFVTKYSQLSGKLCEALTDSLRLLSLEAKGYTVSALELTDPDDTPKNTLLRAVKKPHFSESERSRAEQEYKKALEFLFPDGACGYLSAIGEGE